MVTSFSLFVSQVFLTFYLKEQEHADEKNKIVFVLFTNFFLRSMCVLMCGSSWSKQDVWMMCR